MSRNKLGNGLKGLAFNCVTETDHALNGSGKG